MPPAADAETNSSYSPLPPSNNGSDAKDGWETLLAEAQSAIDNMSSSDED